MKLMSRNVALLFSPHGFALGPPPDFFLTPLCPCLHNSIGKCFYLTHSTIFHLIHNTAVFSQGPDVIVILTSLSIFFLSSLSLSTVYNLQPKLPVGCHSHRFVDWLMYLFRNVVYMRTTVLCVMTWIHEYVCTNVCYSGSGNSPRVVLAMWESEIVPVWDH